MRKVLLSVTAAAAMAVPLVLGGTASAVTVAHTGPAPFYVTTPAHEVHVWHVAHVEHMAYMSSLGY